MASRVPFTSFLSWRLAPSTATERGMPFPSVSKLLFVPFLPLSVGFAPVPSPPKGAFVISPSIDCHSQSIPFFISYSIKPAFHIASNNPAFLHSWNLSCTVLGAPNDLGNAFHWQPVRSSFIYNNFYLMCSGIYKCNRQ